MSLGVDLEEDEHLMSLVQEAFEAPLPSSWTEYMDESNRAYYVKESSLYVHDMAMSAFLQLKRCSS